jgi:hypothetical protein
MAYPGMATVLEPEHQQVKGDWKMVFPITDSLDQVAEQDRLLYPQGGALTTCEKEMHPHQRKESKINEHEHMACVANSKAKS